MATLSKQLQQEVMQTVLSDRERNLLLLVSRGGTQCAVDLYRREYTDKAGVEAEVKRIREKLEGALARRVERMERGAHSDVPVEDAALEASGIRPGERAEENEVELPVRAPRVTGGGVEDDAEEREVAEANASIPDAGATASRLSVGGPPTVAPASEDATGPSLDGSTDVSAPPLSQRAVNARARAAAQPPTERQQAIMDLLRERRRTAKSISVELGIAHGTAKTCFGRMIERGFIERTEQNARDWPNAALVGRASRVLKLCDEPPETQPARGVTGESAIKAHGRSGTRRATAPVKVSRIAPTGACPHGAPHTLCRVCCPALPMEGSSSNGNGRDAVVERFDARKLWDGLTSAQRAELLSVAIEHVAPLVRAA